MLIGVVQVVAGARLERGSEGRLQESVAESAPATCVSTRSSVLAAARITFAIIRCEYRPRQTEWRILVRVTAKNFAGLTRRKVRHPSKPRARRKARVALPIPYEFRGFAQNWFVLERFRQDCGRHLILLGGFTSPIFTIH